MSKAQNLLFIQSILSKDLKKAEEHLSKGSNIDAIGGNENISALHYATLQGDAELIHWLISKGANLLVKGGSGGQVPFHVACMQGNIEIVKLLYQEFIKKKAANSNSEVNHKESSEDMDTGTVLIANTTTNDIPNRTLSDTRIASDEGLLSGKAKKRKASHEGNEQAKKRQKLSHDTLNETIVLTKDTDIVNIQDDNGWTPIICAANFAHIPVMEFLLANGANINQRDLKQRNALQFIIANSPKTLLMDIIIFLLENGCNVNNQDKDKRTALHLAVSNNASKEVIKHLILYGIDTNAKDKRENTAEKIAREMSNTKIADYIEMVKEQKSIFEWMMERTTRGKGIPVTKPIN